MAVFWLVAPSNRRFYSLNTVLVSDTCNGYKIWSFRDTHLKLCQDLSFDMGITFAYDIFYVSIVIIVKLLSSIVCKQCNANKARIGKNR